MSNDKVYNEQTAHEDRNFASRIQRLPSLLAASHEPADLLHLAQSRVPLMMMLLIRNKEVLRTTNNEDCPSPRESSVLDDSEDEPEVDVELLLVVYVSQSIPKLARKQDKKEINPIQFLTHDKEPTPEFLPRSPDNNQLRVFSQGHRTRANYQWRPTRTNSEFLSATADNQLSQLMIEKFISVIAHG